MMQEEQVPSSSIIWHRIKTGLYALAAVIMAGWVTDALNEDLMFRLITRALFPDEVANYKHPLDSLPSLLIWLVPLLVGLILMFIATVMTIHHIKKRHIYVLHKAKRLSKVDAAILAPTAATLAEAVRAYQGAEHLHVLCAHGEDCELFKDIILKSTHEA